MRKIKLILLLFILGNTNNIFAAVEKYDITKHIYFNQSTDWLMEFSADQIINKGEIANTANQLFLSTESTEVKSVINKLLKADNDFLDYQSKSYVILRNNFGKTYDNTVSIYFVVKNYNELIEFINSIHKVEGSSKVKEGQMGDYKVYSNSDYHILCNQNHCIVHIYNRENDAMLSQLITPSSTLANSDISKKLNNKKVDISIMGSLDPLNQPQFTNAIQDLLQKDISNIPFNDIFANVTATFNKGQLLIESELLSNNNKNLEKIEELFMFAKKSNNKLLDYMGSNSIFSFNLALNGAKLSQYINSVKSNLNKSEERVSEIATLFLNEINSDIAFSLNNLTFKGFLPNVDFKAMCIVENKNLFNQIQQSFTNNFVKINDQLIAFDIQPIIKIYVGQVNDMLYITSNEEFAKNPTKVKPNIKKATYYKGKQDFGFAVLDYKEIAKNQSLVDLIAQSGRNSKTLLTQILGISYIKVSHPAVFSNKIEMVLNDKELNSLLFIFRSVFSNM